MVEQVLGDGSQQQGLKDNQSQNLEDKGQKTQETGTTAAATTTAAAETKGSLLTEQAGETPEQKAAREAAEKPVDYKDFTLPEEVSLLPEQLDTFKKLVGAGGLSVKLPQEDAQKLIDFHLELAKKAADESYQDWQKLQDEWKGTAEKDQEFGGPKLAESKRIINQAITQFGTPELKDALEMTGAGNQPEIIRFVYRMASKLVETGTITKGSPAGQQGQDQRSIAERMFPSSAPKQG